MAQPRELGRVGLWRVFSLREVDEVVVDGLEQLAPVSLQPGTDVRHERPLCRRCRIRRCASLAGGGLSAARTVAFARGEASIAARCMRHDSRQRVRELLAER